MAVVALTFAYIYYVKAGGSLSGLVEDIMLLPLILVPLIPAFITMSLARKAEDNLHELLEKMRGEGEIPAAPEAQSESKPKPPVKK